jgi:hypothetical protein
MVAVVVAVAAVAVVVVMIANWFPMWPICLHSCTVAQIEFRVAQKMANQHMFGAAFT